MCFSIFFFCFGDSSPYGTDRRRYGRARPVMRPTMMENNISHEEGSKRMMTYRHRESLSTTLFLVHVTVTSRGTTRQRNVIGWPTSTVSDWLYVVSWPSCITLPVSSCSNCASVLGSCCCNHHHHHHQCSNCRDGKIVPPSSLERPLSTGTFQPPWGSPQPSSSLAM